MIIKCPIDRLLETIPLAEKFHQEAPNSRGAFSPERYFMFWIKRYYEVAGVILVDDVNGEIKSIMGLVTNEDSWSGDKVLHETFWYSTNGSGVKLFNEAIKIAKDIGAKEFIVQHIANEESLKVGEFYLKNEFDLDHIRYSRRF